MVAKKEGKRVSTIVSDYYAKKMDELVEKGYYRNQSDLIRDAIRQFIDLREREVGRAEK